MTAEGWYDHRATVKSYKTTTYDRPIPEWHEQATCAEVAAADPVTMGGAWTSDWHPLEDEAVEICKTRCPVRELCLQAGFEDPLTEGINGGFKFVQGRILREHAKDASKVLNRRIPRTPRFVRNKANNGAQSSSL